MDQVLRRIALVFFVAAVSFLPHHFAAGQPIKLDMEIVEDDNIEPAMPLQVPTNSERMVSLSPPRAYNITCRASVGFGSQAEAWYFAHPNGTFTPISRDPLSEVYQFLPNPLDTYRWILRFKNFTSSFTGKYSCISPNINKSLIINSANPTVITASTQLAITEGSKPNNVVSQRIFISGQPKPDNINVTWSFNNVPFTSSQPPLNILIIPTSIELLFQSNFGFQHEGTYAVTVANSQGTASDSFYIDIQAGPRLQLTASPSTPVIGSTFQLTCTDSKGTPEPQFTWFNNNLPITDGVDGYSISQQQSNVSILTVSSATFQHSGTYKCRANNSADEDAEIEILTVKLPSPSIPTVSLLSGSSPFYVGSSISLSCQSILQSTSLYSGSLSALMVWKRNGVAIPNSQSTVSNDGLVYTSTLSLVAVSHVVDNGTYTCEVTTNSSHGYTSSTQLSNPLHLDIKVPFLSVHLTSSSTSVLNLQPFNLVYFTCIATIPHNLQITANFIWYKMSTNHLLTDGIQNITISTTTNTSVLTLSATDPGTEQYTCSVEFDLPDQDPNITITRNATLNVKGPLSPFVPTNIVTGNIDHSSAVIQWTVPSIAYSPETYYIKYGKSSDNLQFTSNILVGSVDLTARDQTLSLLLQYLEHGTMYYYKIIAGNNNGETTSSVHTFTTLKLALIQFRAGPFRGCTNGRVVDSLGVQTFMKEEIAKAISTSCGCTFPVDNLINGTVLCTQTNSDQLIFRVFVVSTSQLTSATIVDHVTRWIQGDPEVTSGVAKVTFDTTCNVSISSSYDPICPGTVEVVPTDPTTGPVSGYGSNTDILITVVAGAVILVQAVIVIILIAALCYQNSKIRYLMRKRSNYVSVRRASSTVSDNAPASKWKGDAYVTTECPAYLTSYNPKNGNINNNSLKDELDDIEREATPAIYDSIDHLNRRHDIPSAPNPMNIGIGNSDTDDNTADDTTGSTIMTS